METHSHWPYFIRELVQKWPSTIVARDEVGRFSGGLLNPRTLANLDSLGTGPAVRITLGSRKVAYPVVDLCNFLTEKLNVVQRGKHDDK